MPAYTGKDLARAFRGVRGHTIQIANEIPEDQYGVSGAPGTKTVAQLLTHIAFGGRFQRLISGRFSRFWDLTHGPFCHGGDG